MRGEISHEGIVLSFSEISCGTAKIMQVRPVMLTLHILLSSSYHWPTKLSTCLEVGNFLFIAFVVQCYPWFKFWAKLQNAGPLIYISLNHKGPYCVMLRS